jgi:hypothetical protein
MKKSGDAQIELESSNSIRIRFPEGVKAAIRRSIPVEQLLHVLRQPERDAEGHSVDAEIVPGAPD